MGGVALQMTLPLQASRHKIMTEDDPSEMHRLLTNLPLFEHQSFGQIAREAHHLLKLLPPEELVKKSKLRLRM